MKARELMADAPKLKVLLDRALASDFEVDKYDFFYMQGLSERLRKKIPFKKCPTDGYWYAPAEIISGAYAQQKMVGHGCSEECLDLNRKLVEYLIEAEAEIEDGNSGSKEGLYERLKPINKGLREIRPVILPIIREVKTEWSGLWEEFFESCEKESPENIYGNVYFSSPVFERTECFLPLREGRNLDRKEANLLAADSLHETRFYMKGLEKLKYSL